MAWHDRFQEITEPDEVYHARVAAMLLTAEADLKAARADAERLAAACRRVLDQYPSVATGVVGVNDIAAALAAHDALTAETA